MSAPQDRTSQQAWGWSLLVALCLLKLALLWLDPQLRLFLGDSASYLRAARGDDWLPPDRSFTYPWLIEWLAGAAKSLPRLLYAQAAAGVLTAWLLGWWLHRRFDAPARLAFALACLYALAPAQLFYERMVLAETFGLLAFATFFAASAAYLARPRMAWIAAIVLAGLAAASARLNYLPVVLVISLLLPWLALAGSAPPRRRTVFAHALLALACVWFSHGEYRAFVGEQFDRPPAYIGRAGFMRMGLVAPLIRPEHFERVGLPRDYADRLAFDLHDPRTRPSQLWSDGGLAHTLRDAGRDVEAISRKLSAYALRGDPWGVVRLGFGTLGGYFDRERSAMRLAKDLGRDPLPYPDEVVDTIRVHWGYDFSGVAERWTPASRWFAAGSRWLVACLFLLLPLALANLWLHWRDPRRLQALLAALFGIGLVASHVLFSTIASYRYLHAFPFFVLLNGVPVALALWRRRGERTA